MTKVRIAGTVLALALTTVGAQSARADSFTCTVKGIAERPVTVGTTLKHGPAVTCTSGRGAQIATTDSALAARYLSLVTAALLSGRQIFIDVGTCTLATDCQAAGWELK